VQCHLKGCEHGWVRFCEQNKPNYLHRDSYIRLASRMMRTMNRETGNVKDVERIRGRSDANGLYQHSVRIGGPSVLCNYY
jgi:hypothetical protein